MKCYQKIHKFALDREFRFITFLNYLLSYLGLKSQASLFANLLVNLTSS